MCSKHTYTHTCFGVTESCQEKAIVYLVWNQDEIVIIYIYIHTHTHTHTHTHIERKRERESLDLRTH